MPPKSATITVTRAITVAADVYAPGHLGELTQIVPFEMVDEILEETRTVEQRLRDLPSRVGVYLGLAMGLFEQVGLAGVWSKPVAGLGDPPVPEPSETALRDLCRRLGPAPFKALFHLLAGPLAQPHTPARAAGHHLRRTRRHHVRALRRSGHLRFAGLYRPADHGPGLAHHSAVLPRILDAAGQPEPAVHRLVPQMTGNE